MCRRPIPCVSCAAHPEISCPSVSGVASCRCVRPIFTTSANAADLSASTSRSRVTAGTRRCTISSAAARCIAVGNVSFDDCDIFTSSLGWIGVLEPSTPPASWIARFEMTSLAFMLVCVPDPVWKTTSGKCASCCPAMISSQTRTMRSVLSAESVPRSQLVSAAAFLRMPKARIMARVKRMSPMAKFSSDRWVWAPHSLSSATAISPMASRSIRCPVMSRLLSKEYTTPGVCGTPAANQAHAICAGRGRLSPLRSLSGGGTFAWVDPSRPIFWLVFTKTPRGVNPRQKFMDLVRLSVMDQPRARP